MCCKIYTLQSGRGIGSFKEGRSLKAWISGIARNKCADYWRSAQRRITPFPDEALTPLVGALNLTEIDLDARRQEVREAVADLPPIYREVVELHYGESLLVREIAEEEKTSKLALLSVGFMKREIGFAGILCED